MYKLQPNFKLLQFTILLFSSSYTTCYLKSPHLTKQKWQVCCENKTSLNKNIVSQVFIKRSSIKFVTRIVMMLKLWGSIRIFSRIWWYSKYETKKILNTFSCCKQSWQIWGKFFLKKIVDSFEKIKHFATDYSIFNGRNSTCEKCGTHFNLALLLGL